jgi:Ribonuclease G/E
MGNRSIFLDHFQDQEASALVVDGVLQDFFIESNSPSPGQIYRATVDRPIKGQGGYFLKTPDGPAFLRQGKGLSQGSRILVQVSGFAEIGKAIPVSRKILLKSRYVIITPENPGLNISRQIKNEERRDDLVALIRLNLRDFKEGMILRSSCINAVDKEILDDAEEMLNLAEKISSDESNEEGLILEPDKPHALAWREWSEDA